MNIQNVLIFEIDCRDAENIDGNLFRQEGKEDSNVNCNLKDYNCWLEEACNDLVSQAVVILEEGGESS